MADRFSDWLIERAWIRSGGKCECQRTKHVHWGRCNKALARSSQGDRDSSYGWEAHSKSGLHLDSLTDCEILCWNPCHKSTL